LILCFSISLSAQTAGTLTLTYNQPVPTNPAPSYASSVLAVWIEDNAGTFIKTKMRFVGSGTKDHLPTWAVKSGGVASNATGLACNITDATTGATRKATTTPTAFGSKTVVWDGKNVSGSVNGTTVADGIYKIWIESTWVDSGSNNHNEIISFPFTKGPASVHLTPAGDAYINTITLDWVASGLGLENVSEKTKVVVYPNPSNGVFYIDFKNEINNIKVVNMLGQVVYDEKVAVTAAGTVKNIDLSNFENGIYIVNVSNNEGSSSYEVVLDK